ncbi:SpaA isopeptide-forming pilin-related protein [Clostridium sp. LBM24168]
MRKKRFLSIAVSLLFVLQIFISFAPLKSVKADTSTFPLVTENTSTSQGESGGDTETATDQDGSVTQEGPDSQKNIEQDNTTKGSNNTAQQGTEETNGSSENGTQQEETGGQQNANKDFGSDTSQSEGNTTTEPEQNSTTQNSGTTAEQTETPAQEEPADSDPAVTPTVIEFPFITGGTLTDGTGKDISAETDVDKSSDVNINYDFSISKDVAKDTSYSIQLTDQIKLKGVSSELKSSIGSISADPASNKVTVTFTAEVKSGTSGKLSISGQFNKDKIGNSNPVSVNIGKSSVDVNFKQEDVQQNPAEKPGEAVQVPGEQAADNLVTPQDVEPVEPKNITESFPFITGVSIKDANGNDLGNDVDKTSEIHANYTWSIPNTVAVNSGDYYTMQLPEQIHIVAPINQPITDNDGAKVADMYVDTSGLVILTFTDYPGKHSNVNGYFYVDCHFKESAIGNLNPETINFTIPGIEAVPVSVNFVQPTDASFTKSGHYNKSTDEITWTITANSEKIQADNATITDTIKGEEGQVFVPGSITINNSGVGDNYYYDYTKALIFNLGNITDEQTITYKTSVKDFLASQLQGTYNFNNTADFSYDDYKGAPHTKNVNAGTVSVTVTYISKTGSYDSASKRINWTITVNEDSKTINNAVVTDVVPEGLTVTQGSISVKNENDIPLTPDYSGNITFNLGNITGKVTITYSTNVDTSVYNSNGSQTYTNNATFTGNGFTLGTSGHGVGVSSTIVHKQGSGYDASNGIITWTITVNGNKTNVAAGAVVTDDIPVGQTYLSGSAKLDGISIGDSGYTAAPGGDTNKTGTFVYTFADAFSDTHTITLQTQVTDPTHYRANYNGTYSNTVNFTAGPINQDTTGYQPAYSEIIKKTGAGYNYATREATWKIIVNKNAMPITNAVVTDIIPEGQEYVADSASIDDGTHGSFNSNGDVIANGKVVYTFTGTINKTYTITFRTKLTNLNIFNTSGDKTLENTAAITGNEIPSDGDAESKGIQTVKNSVISKTSSYNNGNNYIDWTVKTNANWSIPLSGATITDTLQNGLSLDTDTVKLYSATVNSDGTLTQGSEILLDSSNVAYNPDTRLFTFTFTENAGNEAFILNFRTYTTKTGNFTNSVTFSGSNINQSSSATQNGVWFSTGGGGATGEIGSITVVKVGDDGTTPLSGAVFQLLDQYGNVKETSEATGSDGSVLFDNLKYDINYSIKEITAPIGYNLSSDIHTFQVHSTADQKNITYNFADTIKTGKVTFTKTGEDSDSTGLAGAEFTLYEPDGETPVKDENGNNVTAVSGSDGKVEFNYDVPYGYKIKETKAPTGYTASTQSLTATVDVSGNVILDTSSVADVKIKNSITFTKKDQSGNPLQGAEFTLYQNDGVTPVTDGSGNNITATSDEDGVVTFNNVAYGYKIKETKAPSGYYLSSKVLNAVMKEDNATVALDNVEFIDQKIVVIPQGTVTIQKTDESGNPLKGAEFALLDSTGTPVKTSSTGDDGFARFYSVQPGQYTVKETKAPEGYSISAREIPVQVLQSVEYDLGKFVDEKSSGRIEISKSDFSTQEPVPGAAITIYRDNALTDVVDSKVTGADGKVVFDGLPYGHYYFKETGAPEGYKLNTDVHEFDISENAKNVKDSITDEKISDNSFNIELTADPKSITGDGKSTSTLTAKVVDEDNKPAPGVTVDFSAPNGSFPDGSSAVTDENGEASVVFKSDKIEGIEEKKIPVTAVVNDPEHGLNAKDQIDITFEPGSIKGTVVDNETGNPIAGATVVVEKDFDGDGTIDFTSTVTTSSDGKYEIAVPKGDVEYDVHITVPVQINGKTEDKTFIQKSNPGEIAGNSYDSEKTAAGIVLLKNPDGETAGYFKDYGNITIDVPEIGQQVDIGSDGTFQVGGLEKDREYNFNIIYHFDNGEEIIIGRIDVKMDSDGQMRIDPEPTLIDPYGVVTDSVTGDKIPDADIKLYYADTERNRESGKTPDTLVQLPGLEGFPPADNANPQSSDEEGNYAFMVYPNTDYYIVATKPGYETETTETISVNDAIVKHDIEMDPISSGGAGGGGSASIRGKVNVKKTDKSGNPLKGAEFTLINSKGNSVKTVVTDENGLAEFTKVNPGKYTVKETKAPSGYSISDKILSVEINQSKVYDLGTVQDAKEEGSTPVPPVQPTPEEPEQPGENPDEGNKPDQPNQPGQKPDTNQPGQNSGEGGNSTIGNSANGSSKSQSVQKKSSMETSSVLPRTGSFIDTTILLVAGILLIFAGVLLMFMRKKLY